ncbi:MAG TPA: AAC(3) family N-acetyltransferase [Rhodobacteraceae bacterium]|nr:AAC(3) family N-acetyltransferase [Paracoccaceae bacterium]
MALDYSTQGTLSSDLVNLGLKEGDGVFVHASLGAIGNVVGGARAVINALLEVTGGKGLIAMPGFSTDAYFPKEFDRAALSPFEIQEIENAVLGFDPKSSSALGMGIIAETFRNWPGTIRSQHPTSSVCLLGADAANYIAPHSLEWASGPQSPSGRLMKRPNMKTLLIGVGWNRCSALHVAETLTTPKRTKIRRFKPDRSAQWVETPDVADDLDRLFPLVGSAFESKGKVSRGNIGNAPSRLCGYRDLIEFATRWIGEANNKSGDLR